MRGWRQGYIGAERVRRCSVAGLARDSTLLGGSEPGRMPGVCLLWAGRAALCEMSAPAGAVTSRREALAERPLAEPLPAASAARGVSDSYHELDPALLRCCRSGTALGARCAGWSCRG